MLLCVALALGLMAGGVAVVIRAAPGNPEERAPRAPDPSDAVREGVRAVREGRFDAWRAGHADAAAALAASARLDPAAMDGLAALSAEIASPTTPMRRCRADGLARELDAALSALSVPLPAVHDEADCQHAIRRIRATADDARTLLGERPVPPATPPSPRVPSK